MELINYKNAEFNFTLKYPNTWEIKESYMGSVVAFMAPVEKKELPSNLSISIQVLEELGISTLQEYTEFTLITLKDLVEKFKITQKMTQETIDRSISNNLTFTGKTGDIELKIKQQWTIKEGKAYVIAYTSTIKQFNTYVKDILKILNTFCFIE